MKKLKHIVAALLVIAVSSFSLQGCYGSFVATKKVYRWNGGLGNKWVKTVVLWVFIIVPVYPILMLVDFIALNTLEFWTGSNPLAMGPGDKEVQIVENEGQKFEITATQNRFDIKALEGKNAGHVTTLRYDFKSESWYVASNGKEVKIAEASKANPNKMTLVHPDGEKVNIKL